MFCRNCGKQLNEGVKFCKYCGRAIVKNNLIEREQKIENLDQKQPLPENKRFDLQQDKPKNKLILPVSILLGFIILGGFYYVSESYKQKAIEKQQQIDLQSNIEKVESKDTTQSDFSYNQKEITASVVNILCPSTVSNEDSSGGSGTIISEDGIILTNSHIIPQDENNIHVDEQGCLVVLPDSITGQIKDIYLAYPIVVTGLSDKYDLAYMQIYSAFFDEEKQEYSSVYPRKFPLFDDTNRCDNGSVQLGEAVRIFGYPANSGGYSLTITDGIVSSFPGDELIMTSAKIDSGNSGGLAIDKNGCMIGVPSSVSVGSYESMGIIISTNLIKKFNDEINEVQNYTLEKEIRKNCYDLAIIGMAENFDKNLKNCLLDNGLK